MSTTIQQEKPGNTHGGDEGIQMGERSRTRIMFAPGSKTILRAGAMFFTAVVAMMMLSTSASAVDGRTAVGNCIDSTGRCAWAVNDKGEIDVCSDGGCVTCPSATSECKTARTGRTRPTRPLPVGTRVVTALGSFTVQSGTPSSSATAADAKTAVGRCINTFASGGPCAWSVNTQGEIDICSSGGCVTYSSVTSERTTARKGRPRPTRALPVGTEVVTALGSFKIGRG
jgi:hypothetical protein